MLTHGGIWAAIDALAARVGLSASGLARKSGLDPTTFNKSKRRSRLGKPRWPSTESLAKILTATGCDFGQFFQMAEDSLPLQMPLLRAPLDACASHFTPQGKPSGGAWKPWSPPDLRTQDLFAIEAPGIGLLVAGPYPSFKEGRTFLIQKKAGTLLIGQVTEIKGGKIRLLPLYGDENNAPNDIPTDDIAWRAIVILHIAS